MTWTNPLDKIVPSIRQDYANHIIYGGLFSWAVAAVANGIRKDLWAAWLIATIATSALSWVKKIADYYKEGESIQECVSKAIVTGTVPFFVLVNLAIGW